jgi:hypothetical protein
MIQNSHGYRVARLTTQAHSCLSHRRYDRRGSRFGLNHENYHPNLIAAMPHNSSSPAALIGVIEFREI